MQNADINDPIILKAADKKNEKNVAQIDGNDADLFIFKPNPDDARSEDGTNTMIDQTKYAEWSLVANHPHVLPAYLREKGFIGDALVEPAIAQQQEGSWICDNIEAQNSPGYALLEPAWANQEGSWMCDNGETQTFKSPGYALLEPAWANQKGSWMCDNGETSKCTSPGYALLEPAWANQKSSWMCDNGETSKCTSPGYALLEPAWANQEGSWMCDNGETPKWEDAPLEPAWANQKSSWMRDNGKTPKWPEYALLEPAFWMCDNGEPPQCPKDFLMEPAWETQAGYWMCDNRETPKCPKDAPLEPAWANQKSSWMCDNGDTPKWFNPALVYYQEESEEPVDVLTQRMSKLTLAEDDIEQGKKVWSWDSMWWCDSSTDSVAFFEGALDKAVNSTVMSIEDDSPIHFLEHSKYDLMNFEVFHISPNVSSESEDTSTLRMGPELAKKFYQNQPGPSAMPPEPVQPTLPFLHQPFQARPPSRRQHSRPGTPPDFKYFEDEEVLAGSPDMMALFWEWNLPFTGRGRKRSHKP